MFGPLLRRPPSAARPLTRRACAAPPLLADDPLTAERRAAFAARASRLRLPAMGDGRAPSSAVLVPLCRVAGRPGLLFTRRASALRRHSAEVAFPGGRCDAGDDDPLATALRETREEVGLRVRRDQLWAALPPLLAAFGERPVASFVADVGAVEPDRLRLQRDEVADVFFLSLEHLCRPENVGHTQFRGKNGGYSLPVFLNGPHRVWGLTAILTHMTLLSLLPERYRYKPRFLKPVQVDL